MDVREADAEEICRVHNAIPEFEPRQAAHFRERTDGKDRLFITAFLDGSPAGYLASYDRYGDGSLYCWMAGVVPAYRKSGVLKALMRYQEDWARKKGYEKIRIKTRNSRRAMLSYLVRYGFLFTAVEEKDDPRENRILLEKEL